MLAILLVAGTAIPAMAADKGAQAPGLVITEVVAVTAKVQDIDLQKRSLTLLLPEGRTMTVKVGDSVQNFDQIQKGDRLVAKYCDSVALFLRKSRAKPEMDEVTMAEVAPRGQKPAGMVVNTFEISAKVEAVSYKKRTVTLKGPEGNLVTLKVHKTAKNFDKVRRGDDVVARITEALAISVQKQ